MIKAYAHKYGVSALCKVLNISSSTCYYEAKMKREGLASSYTLSQFRPQRDTCNESKTTNVVNRQFKEQPYRNVVVSNLTYIRFGNIWNCICVLIDFFNREIIGYSSGPNRTADIVKQAFQTVPGDLRDICISHTDRGNEFKNRAIDETLEAFEIRRFLRHKRCPYDSAVAKAAFKIIKTEFVRNQRFCNLYQLQIQLSDYVNWFNNHRIHFSLNYMTPVEYRENTLKKVV